MCGLWLWLSASDWLWVTVWLLVCVGCVAVQLYSCVVGLAQLPLVALGLVVVCVVPWWFHGVPDCEPLFPVQL